MTCQTKFGFITKHEAKQMLASCRVAAEAGYSHRQERRIYRCQCGLYHLTSQPHRRWDADELEAA
jgi:hypothetical protein